MSRRLNGEGTVYRDSRGNYVARFQDGWNPETGRPRIRSFSAPTKQGALKRMRAYQKQKRVLKDIPILQTYLSEAMLDWLENKKKLQLKPTSYDRLCSTVSNHIIPKLGNRVIAEINSDMIQSELITPIYKSGLSQSSVRKVYQALNNFFEQLIIEDKLVKNPLKGVVLPSESSFSKTKVIRALSLEEIKRLEAAATRKCESVDKPVYRFGYYYMFILYTGIRCGEALALKWKNVDVENKKLYIEQNLVLARGDDGKLHMQLQSTKSKSGCRTVYLNAKAAKYFESHKALYYDGNDEGFVATSRNGNVVRTRNFEKYLNYIYAAAGIEATGLHILRHTYCSLLFSKGCDIKYIANQMGHSSTEVTLNTYAHLFPETENRYRKLLDTL